MNDYYGEPCICGCDRGEHATRRARDIEAGECHACRDCFEYVADEAWVTAARCSSQDAWVTA